MIDSDGPRDYTMSHLSNQIEVYTHLQNVGYKLSRFVLTIFGGVLAIFGILVRLDAFEMLMESARNYLSSAEVFMNAWVFAFNSLLIVTLYFLIMVMLLDSLFLSSITLKQDNLEPLLGKYENGNHEEKVLYGNNDEPLNDYLTSNAKLISKIHKNVRNSITSLQISFLLSVIFILILLTWIEKSINILIFIDLMLFLGPIVIGLALKYKYNTEEGFRNAISRGYENVFGSYSPSKAMSKMIKINLIIIYSYSIFFVVNMMIIFVMGL